MSNDVIDCLSEISKWMSVGNVSHRLHCSRQWVNNLIVRGELRAIQTEIGHLIEPASVDAYERERERTANAQARKRLQRKIVSTSEPQTH